MVHKNMDNTSYGWNDARCTSYGWNDAGCTACEMTLVWIKICLGLNKTEDQILDYANSIYHSSIFIWSLIHLPFFFIIILFTIGKVKL